MVIISVFQEQIFSDLHHRLINIDLYNLMLVNKGYDEISERAAKLFFFNKKHKSY